MPFFELVKAPACALGPAPLLGPKPTYVESKKKRKKKGVYATKRSVETVPSVSLDRASGNPWVIGQDLVSQVPGHIPLKESFSDSKTLSSTLGPVIPAPNR